MVNANTRGEGGDGAWRILVVEDEYYIADDLRRELEAKGAEVLGPVPKVEEALALICAEPGIQAAVLDVKLGDELVWPVVDALRERGVKYLYATGYSDTEVPPAYQDAPLFRKPLETGRLVKALLEQRNLS